MRSVITVASNRDLANWLTETCQDLKDTCVYRTLASYPLPSEMLQLASIFFPDAVLLDLSAPNTALPLAGEMRACFPRTAIIGLVQDETDIPPEKAAEAGVTQIIAAPCGGTQFATAFEEAVAKRQAQVADNILAFMPGKPGSGATTMALHVASALAEGCGRKLLLLEGDLCSGILCHMLELQPEGNVIQAIEMGNTLADGPWSRLVTKIRGFDLLPMPPAREPATLTRWDYQRLLTFARSRYDTIMLDLPETVDENVAGLVSQAHSVYVVTTPERSSLLLARRRVEELRAACVPESRVKLLLTRRWERREKDSDLEEIEKYLGRDVEAWFPEEPSLLHRTSLIAAPISSSTELGYAYLSFAHSLAGLEPPEALPPPVAEGKPKKLRSLFNRMPLAKSARTH